MIRMITESVPRTAVIEREGFPRPRVAEAAAKERALRGESSKTFELELGFRV